MHPAMLLVFATVAFVGIVTPGPTVLALYRRQW
jgi:threonine/homoserine/homoserine lactone efflux protein